MAKFMKSNLIGAGFENLHKTSEPNDKSNSVQLEKHLSEGKCFNLLKI